MAKCYPETRTGEGMFFLLGILIMIWFMMSLNKETSSSYGGFVGLFIALTPFIGMWLADALEFISLASPQRMITCIGKQQTKTELEKLEIAHKEALEYADDAFKNSIIGWMLSGIATIFIEVSILQGWVIMVAPLWVSFAIVSVIGAASFILMIISYLRKRSIEKALFAIQLKKSDKAEISIKI